MSDLQNLLRQRLASGLKPSVTNVTTASGRRFVEKGGELFPLEPSMGFVVDNDPDMRMAKIRPRLYLGSQDVASDWNSLKSKNVTNILNLAARSVVNMFENRIVYKSLGWLDLPEFDVADELGEVGEFIEDALRSGGTVFVHCNAGVSRAPTAIMAYLIWKEGISTGEALAAVRFYRPCVCPNKGFLKALQVYENLSTGKVETVGNIS